MTRSGPRPRVPASSNDLRHGDRRGRKWADRVRDDRPPDRSRSSAFLSGPIAARLTGTGGLLLVPAGLVGALLVLVADFTGQYAFDTRYPVGIVTGVPGAPSSST
ncbi:hypothetical protein LV779_15665 [Streptomyces thinghirensis]|nr:hypothetical protein [Streptomyces thinghirensis]